MGEKEEGREEGKKEEGGSGKSSEEKKEAAEDEAIVLKVDMHCEACARKVVRSLKGFQGVEEVSADCKVSRVVVKGKEADPAKVCERVQKKSGRKVEIVSPLPKPPKPDGKDQAKEKPKEEKKDEPPAAVTVVLKIAMHCEACAQGLQRRIRKIPGVESVTADLGNCQIVVAGVIDPVQLVNDVYKRTRKQASIVKEEENKEEEKKKEGGEEGKSEEEKMQTALVKKSEYWPPRYNLEYAYPTQMFSDENPHACSIA